MEFLMRILGSGHYVPKNIVTNDDLSKIVDTNDEWISSRTGISTRYISDGEGVSDLASKAALLALKDANISATDIDMILLATMTPDSMLPNNASIIQKNIGAINATCFDINAACSGFLFALNTAHAYLSSGMCKNILVIGAETLSKIVDWSDRASCVLFGDGAGAMVVTADDTKAFYSVSGSDGSKGHVLTGGATLLKNMLVNSEETNIMTDNYYMHMDGQEVFKFAVTKVPECINEVLTKANLTAEDIDCFILHQANVRIISSVAKRLGVSPDKLPINLNKYGNTSAATIPILFDELKKSGSLDNAKRVIFSGFGGGLTWGASLVEL
jgi:3-oxoacyl-[acyl-carrier-protein] synthase-3